MHTAHRIIAGEKVDSIIERNVSLRVNIKMVPTTKLELKININSSTRVAPIIIKIGFGQRSDNDVAGFNRVRRFVVKTITRRLWENYGIEKIVF